VLLSEDRASERNEKWDGSAPGNGELRRRRRWGMERGVPFQIGEVSAAPPRNLKKIKI